MRSRTIIALLAAFLSSLVAGASPEGDKKTDNARQPATMPISIRPFYDSDGPKVWVGKYSKELATADAKTILELSTKFENERDKLRAEEMYVLAVRLFDLGQKDDAVYWFYTAQYRGRLFRGILDPDKGGGIGSAEFELPAAFAAFDELAGEHINEYAFGNLPRLEETLAKVKEENKSAARMADIYPKVHFVPEGKWDEKNDDIAKGLGDMIDYIKANGDKIKEERKKNGVDPARPHAAVDGKDPDNFTPLMETVRSNRSVQAVTDLVKAGADVNAETKSFDDTPLMLAARLNKNPEVATALIQLGAKVNFRNKSGETPLGEAAGSNTSEVVAVLIKAGAEVNAKGFDGDTPLMAAASRNPKDSDIIFALLKAGADVNIPDKNGETPLMSAVAVHDVNMEVIAALIKAGAKVNAKDKDDRTPLMHWAMGGNFKSEVVTTLVKAGADINAKDNDGQTPLIRYARFESNPEIITALVASGADVTIKDKDGKTAMDYARKAGGSPALVAALEKAEAK